MDNYGSPELYQAYKDALGYATASPGVDPVVALLNGSRYIDGKYRSGFSGTKLDGRSQDREWPRENATDASGTEIPITEIPEEIEHATYEAAWRFENGVSLLPDYTASERVTSERVGSLAVSYAQSGSLQASDTYPVIATIDQILAPLLRYDVGSSSRLFGESVRTS